MKKSQHINPHLIILLFLLAAPELSFADSTTWVQVANMEAEARHRCSSFSIGGKGYVGLGHYNSVVGVNNVFEDFWEYDPATNTWTQKANYGGGKHYHCFEFVINNKAYVGCGRNSTGTQFKENWEFDPVTNVWTRKADFPGSARQGPHQFVIDGIGYVGTGGASSATDDNAFYAYNPVTDSWTPKATFPGSPRTAGVSFSIQKIGYIATGGNNNSKDLWAYNSLTNSWTQKADIGLIDRYAPTGFTIGDKAYILTGTNFSMDFNDVYEYDPLLDTTIQIGDFPGTKRHFSCAFVINNKAYFGSGTSGINFNDLWVFDPRFKNLSKTNYDPNVSKDLVTNEINIRLAQKREDPSKTLVLKILDTDMNVIAIQPFEGDASTLQQNNIGAGLYFYQIHSKDKMIQYGRFTFV